MLNMPSDLLHWPCIVLKSQFHCLLDIGHAVARPLLWIDLSSQLIHGKAEQAQK